MTTHDALTTPEDDHLVELPGTGWHAWRWGLVRSAGFPVEGLDDLSAPGCAEAADATLDKAALDSVAPHGAVDSAAAGGATGHDGPDDALGQAMEIANRHIAKALVEVAGLPDFQAALIWQNPGALTSIAGTLRDGPDAPRNDRRRRREEIIAKYWQRYCGKNDSIGFFGPMCWVQIDPTAPPVTGAHGPQLTRQRVVHLEWWALAALARTLADDRAIRPWLPLVRQPHIEMSGRELRLPGAAPAQLPAPEAALVGACDGHRSAVEIADALVADAALGLYDRSDVYLMAERLIARGLLRWGFDLPFNLDAERVLRAGVAGIADEAARARATAVLARVFACRDEVAATTDPDALADALSALDDEFSEVTGLAAQRRAGQTYAGRTLCHIDAVRDLDLTFGEAVLAKLAPLAPLLRSARWLTAALADAYTKVLGELYDELAAERGSVRVPFEELWFLAQGALFGAAKPADPVVAEYLRRWQIALGLDATTPGTRRLDLCTQELSARVDTLFPADRPGWARARFHSPDVHICAPDRAAVERGDFSLVLGELHIGLAALDTHFFKVGHPAPDALVTAMARDITAARIHPVTPEDWPRMSARNADWLVGADDIVLGFAPGSGVDRQRLIPITALGVHRGPDGLVITAADGRSWPVIEAYAELIGLHAFDAWKLAGVGGHTPRVSVDDLVLLRETWRTNVEETGLADAVGERARVLAVRRWRRALDLPERVFVRVATETKPCYVDLTSPVYARILCNLMRGARATGGPATEVAVTEMLPTAQHAWLTDAYGRRYTSELRLQLRDPATAGAHVPGSDDEGLARAGA